MLCWILATLLVSVIEVAKKQAFQIGVPCLQMVIRFPSIPVQMDMCVVKELESWS